MGNNLNYTCIRYACNIRCCLSRINNVSRRNLDSTPWESGWSLCGSIWTSNWPSSCFTHS